MRSPNSIAGPSLRAGDQGQADADEQAHDRKPNDIEAYVRRVRTVLEEPGLWPRLSAAAVASARGHVGLDHVTALWRDQIAAVLRRTAGEGRPATGASTS